MEKLPAGADCRRESLDIEVRITSVTLSVVLILCSTPSSLWTSQIGIRLVRDQTKPVNMANACAGNVPGKAKSSRSTLNAQ